MKIEVDAATADRLQYEAMVRLRWRLWFAFTESKYVAFRYKGRKGKPDFARIKQYCLEHWGKEPADMTLDELRKYIAIVAKWKSNAEDKR